MRKNYAEKCGKCRIMRNHAENAKFHENMRQWKNMRIIRIHCTWFEQGQVLHWVTCGYNPVVPVVLLLLFIA